LKLTGIINIQQSLAQSMFHFDFEKSAFFELIVWVYVYENYRKKLLHTLFYVVHNTLYIVYTNIH